VKKKWRKGKGRWVDLKKREGRKAIGKKLGLDLAVNFWGQIRGCPRKKEG